MPLFAHPENLPDSHLANFGEKTVLSVLKMACFDFI